jgi:hypothetical protein
MFRIDGPQLERLFSGAPTAIKKDIDLETASRFRDAFKKAGALVELKKVGSQAATSAAPSPAVSGGPAQQAAPKAPEGLDLAAPRTGSLIDCAPKEDPVPIPDISAIGLAEPGALVAQPSEEPAAPTPDLSGIELAEPGSPMADGQPLPPPPQVDTDGLELAPAHTGSLEDCAREESPVAIPSIDHLEVVEPEKGRG